MKKSPILLFALLAAILFACGSNDNSPTGVAKDLLAALEKQDDSKVNNLLCSTSLVEISLLGGQEGVKIRFSNVDYTETNQADDVTDVEVTGRLETVASGTKIEKDFAWLLKMKKKNGGWCVDSVNRIDV